MRSDAAQREFSRLSAEWFIRSLNKSTELRNFLVSYVLAPRLGRLTTHVDKIRSDPVGIHPVVDRMGLCAGGT